MKITPLEIRQKTFEKKLRGFDKDEVLAFMASMSQEWEKVLDEVKELKIKLQSSEKESSKLREVENSLFKTLKTAEDAGANVVEQANRAAELHLRETQWKAEAMINEAKNSAKTIIEDSETKSKEVIGDMETELKTLGSEYKTLDQQKDKLMTELRNVSTETLDRIEKIGNARSDFDVDAELKRAKREARNLAFATSGTKPEVKSKKPVENKKEVPISIDLPNSEPKENDGASSFFDSIE